jgi:hypothetical protein
MVPARVGALRARAPQRPPNGAREEPSSMRSNRRTQFTSVSFLVFAPILFAVGGLAACSAPATSATTSATTSALATGSGGADGGVPAELASCLTTYVECVRATSDNATCRSDLHACLAPSRPDAGGERGDCGGPDPRGGPGGGPPEGDQGGDPPNGDPGAHGQGGPGASGPDGGGAPPGQEPPPPPPRQDDGGGAPPSPPPGQEPPPPPPGADGGGGPFACFAALDSCAAGTESAESCVATAVTCFSAFPPPPHSPRH